MRAAAVAPRRRLAVRPRLSSRGVVSLLLGAVLLALGLWWHYPGATAFGAALLALVALALASVSWPVALWPWREITPQRVARHGECTATLRVHSNARRFAVRLDASERIGGRRVPIVVPRLQPGRTIESSYPIPTERRGVVPVGPLRLRRVGVAGLAAAAGTLGGTLEVYVCPRVLPVLGLPSGARRGHVGADERVERGGTDLVALREYVPGDDLRRLHWATTARTGTLMVREDADPARPYLTVLLDDRAGSYAGDGLEDAVEVAASLANTAAEQGHPVHLSTVSGSVEFDLPAAPPGMLAPGAGELLGRLAELAAADDDVAVAPLPVRDLDVVAVVTGSGAEDAALLSEATRAPVGVVLVVDAERSGPDAHGPVLVLRGARAEDLLRQWDLAVPR